MRSFRCACGNKVYFENDRCLQCGAALAFDAEQLLMRPVVPQDRLCANHEALGTCNWLALAPHDAYCLACSLNEVVPNLDDPRRRQLYAVVEKAKRRLLYTLLALGLPLEGRAERSDGLAFHILADARLDDAELDGPAADAVMTGHLEGRITINLLEADPPLRERMRAAMNEPYRTVLGHFRHESGHYYWQRLGAGGQGCFRALFGDERAPYQERLTAHYQEGPPPDWSKNYIGAYAASHPLEDFAECWAHYLHIVDTLQTAAEEHVTIDGRVVRDPFDETTPFAAMMADWPLLAAAMNDLNRSLGLDDAYPFATPPPVVAKLRFVHDLIRDAVAA